MFFWKLRRMLIPKWVSTLGVSISFQKPLRTEEVALIVKTKKITHYRDIAVYEFHCDGSCGNWWLKSLGGPDHVSEVDVIKMYNMIEVDRAYRVKYEIRGHIIEKVISVNGIPIN